MSNAYWLVPPKHLCESQSQVQAVLITHIDFIIDNPNLFALKLDDIKSIYKSHNEKLRFEGKARNIIMANLLDKGFVRLRKDIKANTWKVNIAANISELQEYKNIGKISSKYGRISYDIEQVLRKLTIWYKKVKSNMLYNDYDVLILTTQGEQIKFTRSDFDKLIEYSDNFIKNQPKCLSCKYSTWAVGIGQGFFCTNPSKIQIKDSRLLESSTGFKRYMIPSRQYSCEFYELNDCCISN